MNIQKTKHLNYSSSEDESALSKKLLIKNKKQFKNAVYKPSVKEKIIRFQQEKLQEKSSTLKKRG